MKKFYSLLAISTFAMNVSAQAFTATFSFDGSPVNKSAVVAGEGLNNLTVSNFSVTGISEVTSTKDRYATNSHSTSASIATGKYYTVTITPKTSYKLNLDNISVKFQRSNTGPAAVVIRTSEDNYAANTTISKADPAGTITNNALIFNSNNNGNTLEQNQFSLNIEKTSSTPVTLRIYPYNAGNGSTGTFSIDDIIISGESIYDATLAVGDLNATKVNLVKNTIVSNEIIFDQSAKVSITNMNGQIVKTVDVKDNDRLNISEFVKGTYIVTATINGKSVSQKIIKK